jgi:hypothetical protein
MPVQACKQDGWMKKANECKEGVRAGQAAVGAKWLLRFTYFILYYCKSKGNNERTTEMLI